MVNLVSTQMNSKFMVEKLKCFYCKSKVKKIRVSGRGTYICVKCQKNINNIMEPTKILKAEYEELHTAVADGKHEYHCFYLATVNFKTQGFGP